MSARSEADIRQLSHTFNGMSLGNTPNIQGVQPSGQFTAVSPRQSAALQFSQQLHGHTSSGSGGPGSASSMQQFGGPGSAASAVPSAPGPQQFGTLLLAPQTQSSAASSDSSSSLVARFNALRLGGQQQSSSTPNLPGLLAPNSMTSSSSVSVLIPTTSSSSSSTSTSTVVKQFGLGGGGSGSFAEGKVDTSTAPVRRPASTIIPPPAGAGFPGSEIMMALSQIKGFDKAVVFGSVASFLTGSSPADRPSSGYGPHRNYRRGRRRGRRGPLSSTDEAHLAMSSSSVVRFDPMGMHSRSIDLCGSTAASSISRSMSRTSPSMRTYTPNARLPYECRCGDSFLNAGSFNAHCRLKHPHQRPHKRVRSRGLRLRTPSPELDSDADLSPPPDDSDDEGDMSNPALVSILD